MCCVDDGSTDGTLALLNEYAKKDERIKVFHTPNGGASSARNFALSKVEDEEWIWFVDADDYVAPTMYESIFKALGSEEEVDYVRLRCQRSAERYAEKHFSNEETAEIVKRTMSREDYFLHEDVGGFICSLFVKASVVKSNNLSFREDMATLEDQAFSISCATHARKLLVLDSPRNYFYFSGNEHSVSRTRKDMSNDVIRCVNIVYEALLSLQSKSVIDDYFYSRYLPIKLEALYSNRLQYRQQKPSETFLPEINISMRHLSLRATVKCLLTKVLRLL